MTELKNSMKCTATIAKLENIINELEKISNKTELYDMFCITGGQGDLVIGENYLIKVKENLTDHLPEIKREEIKL